MIFPPSTTTFTTKTSKVLFDFAKYVHLDLKIFQLHFISALSLLFPLRSVLFTLDAKIHTLSFIVARLLLELFALKCETLTLHTELVSVRLFKGRSKAINFSIDDFVISRRTFCMFALRFVTVLAVIIRALNDTCKTFCGVCHKPFACV